MTRAAKDCWRLFLVEEGLELHYNGGILCGGKES